VALSQLLEPTITRHAPQFRPGIADTEQQIGDTAELLTDQGMHLAMTRPSLSPTDVADRICSTTLAGMMRRRP
jgi:hypothetical protein